MRRRRIGALLGLAWLAAIAASTLIVHAPFTGTVAQALANLLIDLLAVALMLTLGGGIGTLLMRDPPRISGLSRTALRALVGLAAISGSVLLIGLLGLFPPRWLAWIVMAALAAALNRPIRAWLLDLRENACLPFVESADGFTRWVRRAVIFLLALSFLLALAPPTAWDSLTYHLAGPRLYLDVGRIASFPENHFLGFPQLVEMLYLWLMILARPQAAAILHWCFGVLVLLALLGLARRMRRPGAAWLAALILLAGESLWLEFRLPYNDLATMAYVLAALMALLACQETGSGEQRRLLAWAGVFTGLAMGTKYTAAGAAIGIAALVVWMYRRAGVAAIVRRLALVSGVALIVFAPWLVKNALLDGNPISPFGWGTAGFDALDQWYYLRPGTGLGWRSLLALPVEATVFGREGLAPYGGTISPLIVGLLPLVALGWKRRSDSERAVLSALLIFAAAAYLVWLYGTATSWFLVQTRLLFAIFPALALVGAVGFESLRETAPADLTRLIRGLVLIVIAVAVLATSLLFVHLMPLSAVTGMQSEEDYLIDQLGVHYAAMQEINRLPGQPRVLTLWEPGTFYCLPQRCVPDSMIDQWWHDRQIESDPAQIAAQWRAQGITHVLIFEAGLEFLVDEEPHEPLTRADLDALDRLRNEEMTLLWDGLGAYTLYELKGASGQ